MSYSSEKEKRKYDPRRDLVQDSKLWQMVLRTAEAYDRETYGTLHGFRCYGCRLVLTRNGKIIMKPGNGWSSIKEWEKNKKEYLIPLADKIKTVFSTVEKFLKEKRVG